jgi:hypothetical protein
MVATVDEPQYDRKGAISLALATGSGKYTVTDG